MNPGWLPGFIPRALEMMGQGPSYELFPRLGEFSDHADGCWQALFDVPAPDLEENGAPCGSNQRAPPKKRLNLRLDRVYY